MLTTTRRVEQAVVRREPRLLRAVDGDEDARRRVGRAARARARAPRGRGTRTRREAAASRRAPSRCPCRAAAARGASPSSEPSASPSGFSCDVTRKRSCVRSASTTARMSVAASSSLVVSGPGRARRSASSSGRRARPTDRRRTQLGRPAQVQLPVDARLQDAARRRRAPSSVARALLLAAVDAEPHRRLGEVGRRLDPGHGDEADPRVLQRRDRLGDDLPCIASSTSPHAAAHRDRAPSHRASRARARAQSSSNSCPASQRSAVSSSRSASPASRATHGEREARALPDVVMVDLGDRAAPTRFVQLRLHRAQVHPLLLQRVASGKGARTRGCRRSPWPSAGRSTKRPEHVPSFEGLTRRQPQTMLRPMRWGESGHDRRPSPLELLARALGAAPDERRAIRRRPPVRGGGVQRRHGAADRLWTRARTRRDPRRRGRASRPGRRPRAACA